MKLKLLAASLAAIVICALAIPANAQYIVQRPFAAPMQPMLTFPLNAPKASSAILAEPQLAATKPDPTKPKADAPKAKPKVRMTAAQRAAAKAKRDADAKDAAAKKVEDAKKAAEAKRLSDIRAKCNTDAWCRIVGRPLRCSQFTDGGPGTAKADICA